MTTTHRNFLCFKPKIFSMPPALAEFFAVDFASLSLVDENRYFGHRYATL